MQVSTQSSKFPGLLLTLFTFIMYASIGMWLASSLPEFTGLLESIKSEITSLASTSNPLR